MGRKATRQGPPAPFAAGIVQSLRRASVLAALALASCRSEPKTAGGSSGPAAVSRASESTARRTLRVELLALDFDTCGRCAGTSRNLDKALALAADRLRSEGTEVEVGKTVVATAKQAEELRFASSPTIRVDGRDIALDLRENDCRECGDLCGQAGGVACRVWVWRGREYLDAPVPMIVDAVLGAAHEETRAVAAPATPFVLPENLRKFFEAREALTGTSRRGGGG